MHFNLLFALVVNITYKMIFRNSNSLICIGKPLQIMSQQKVPYYENVGIFATSKAESNKLSNDTTFFKLKWDF